VTNDGFLWIPHDSLVFQHPLLNSTYHVDFCFNRRPVYLNLVNKGRIDMALVASHSYIRR
jgi:hypothetical protein